MLYFLFPFIKTAATLFLKNKFIFHNFKVKKDSLKDIKRIFSKIYDLYITNLEFFRNAPAILSKFPVKKIDLLERDLNFLRTEIKINKKIIDDKEKLKGYLKLSLGTKDFEIEINNNDAKIKLKNTIPKEAEERLKNKIIELIPNIKKIEFTIEQQKNK